MFDPKMGEGAVELVKKLNCSEANIHCELKDIDLKRIYSELLLLNRMSLMYWSLPKECRWKLPFHFCSAS